jgi:hypothetical protein
MSRIRTPENIEIAALKKKQNTVFDPMRAGVGTPWEDRGTRGTIGAFFKTCGMSMFSPGKLTLAIRRPETTNDARGFLFGICGIWAVTAVMHYAIFVWRASRPANATVDTQTTAILGALCLLAGSVGTFFLFKVYTGIYGKLTAQEKDAVLLPDVLIFNVGAYALGPSLLALIPFAGPLIALVWIFASQIAVGVNRLRLRLPAAIIDALISLAAVVAIVVVGYLVIEVVLLHKVMGYDAVTIPETHPTPSLTGN